MIHWIRKIPSAFKGSVVFMDWCSAPFAHILEGCVNTVGVHSVLMLGVGILLMPLQHILALTR
jgi:hypothetical protein